MKFLTKECFFYLQNFGLRAKLLTAYELSSKDWKVCFVCQSLGIRLHGSVETVRIDCKHITGHSSLLPQGIVQNNNNKKNTNAGTLPFPPPIYLVQESLAAVTTLRNAVALLKQDQFHKLTLF